MVPLVGPVQVNLIFSPGAKPLAFTEYDSPIRTREVVNVNRAVSAAAGTVDDCLASSAPVPMATARTITTITSSPCRRNHEPMAVMSERRGAGRDAVPLLTARG